MALNATIFPPLDLPTLGVDFMRWVPRAGDGQPDPHAPITMLHYVRELDRRLETPVWRDAKRRIVVAHSFGGMLTLAWWLEHGGRETARIDGLVLTATTAGPMYGAVRARVLTAGGHDLRVPVAPFLPIWNMASVTRACSAVLGGRSDSPPMDFSTLRHRGDLAVGLAGWRGTDWRARRGHRFAMLGFDRRRRLGEIDVPAIVLHGGRDRLFPQRGAEALAEGLPRAELRLIPDAGHMLPLTHPAELVTAVRALL